MTKVFLFSYLLLITVASLLPSAGESELVELQTSIPATIRHAHLPAYAVLVILALTAYAWSARPLWPAVVRVGGICFGFGVLLEIIQGAAIPGRSALLADVIANAAGIVVGSAVWLAVRATVRLWDGSPVGTAVRSDGMME